MTPADFYPTQLTYDLYIERQRLFKDWDPNTRSYFWHAKKQAHKVWNKPEYGFQHSVIAYKAVNAYREWRLVETVANRVSETSLDLFFAFVVDTFTHTDWDAMELEAVRYADAMLDAGITDPALTDVARSLVIQHLFDETWCGFFREDRILDELETFRPEMKWREATKEEDRKYAVDVIGSYEEDGRVKVVGVQVKNALYVRSLQSPNPLPAILQSRGREIPKHDAFRDEVMSRGFDCVITTVVADGFAQRSRTLVDADFLDPDTLTAFVPSLIAA